MNIVLLGAPGAGKGTQGERLSGFLKIPKISTGDILREAIRNGTELGIEAKRFMDKGELVPDQTVVGIVNARIDEKDAEQGFILDGFPRTVAQAESLSARLATTSRAVDLVAVIDVPESFIVSRLSGRRSCAQCGTPFHVDFAPSEKGELCDRCGGRLYQRQDDDETAVRRRLVEYRQKTAPLVEYFVSRVDTCSIDGVGTPDEVFVRLLGLVQHRDASTHSSRISGPA